MPIIDIPEYKEGRKLVWHDEFNGNSLNENNWTNERLMGHPKTVYDNSDKNLRVENGNLHLLINRIDGDVYTTAESVTTKYKMLFKYGYLEMRAKLPFRHGAWPSFWLKGDTPLLRKKEGRNNWFPETDVFEVFSSDYCLSANLHKWGTVDGKSVHTMLPGEENNKQRAYKFKNKDTLNDEYHTYGMLWDEHSVRFSVDGEFYFESFIDERAILNDENYPDMTGFHDPWYIIINNELFTNDSYWCPTGAGLTENDKMPIEYFVDYVRLYQNENETIIVGDGLNKIYKNEGKI